MKQKNLQSLNEINKKIEKINNLDLTFNTIQEETESIVKEAKENYISTLNNFEVSTEYSFCNFNRLFNIFFIFFRNYY